MKSCVASFGRNRASFAASKTGAPHLSDAADAGGLLCYHNGIPRVAGGATEPTQTPCGPFSEVMVKTTFDLLTSSAKMSDEDL